LAREEEVADHRGSAVERDLGGRFQFRSAGVGGVDLVGLDQVVVDRVRGLAGVEELPEGLVGISVESLLRGRLGGEVVNIPANNAMTSKSSPATARPDSRRANILSSPTFGPSPVRRMAYAAPENRRKTTVSLTLTTYHKA
jgi:hypothetical protein